MVFFFKSPAVSQQISQDTSVRERRTKERMILVLFFGEGRDEKKMLIQSSFTVSVGVEKDYIISKETKAHPPNKNDVFFLKYLTNADRSGN